MAAVNSYRNATAVSDTGRPLNLVKSAGVTSSDHEGVPLQVWGSLDLSSCENIYFDFGKRVEAGGAGRAGAGAGAGAAAAAVDVAAGV